jgi:ABC-type branched-subunit amino acid transport system ATPase component
VSAAPAVTVQHLVKRYRHLVAVNDVSLSIHEGEIFGIIGPNGAGKTCRGAGRTREDTPLRRFGTVRLRV